ncbi:glutamic acid-rich protein-like [Anoplophora glabripennis]|uniref:glutamic acid-rich protein-like n=1 Tax=Anoplophora glabripennis TaxID=217634 RepID=UPI000C783B1D|nr:glutamic acid-rich protein-like [Anoplophora glabripennis]
MARLGFVNWDMLRRLAAMEQEEAWGIQREDVSDNESEVDEVVESDAEEGEEYDVNGVNELEHVVQDDVNEEEEEYNEGQVDEGDDVEGQVDEGDDVDNGESDAEEADDAVEVIITFKTM